MPNLLWVRSLFVAIAFSGILDAQRVFIRPAPKNILPEIIDGNTAAYWRDGVLTIFHSSGVPTLSQGPSQFELGPAIPVHFDNDTHKPVWFEAVWRDSDGTLFLWYHHEPRVCGEKLAGPKIGAAISHDGGFTVQDLGIVLESSDPPKCDAKNGFFATGHGDMSAVYDNTTGYFYFFFTNYGGPASGQGVATARMAFEDRLAPQGRVFKYHDGAWESPGVGGAVSPIFPAARAWEHDNADSHWGPAVHYNTYLKQWVMLLNRACCEPGWPQAGVYLSFNADLAAPTLWKAPRQILEPNQYPLHPGFYPQILGLEPDGTDTLGGQVSRLYLHGVSVFELAFDEETPIIDEPVDDSLNPLPAEIPKKKKS